MTSDSPPPSRPPTAPAPPSAAGPCSEPQPPYPYWPH